jgi:hypothetical protein
MYNAMDERTWRKNDTRQRRLTDADAVTTHTVKVAAIVAGDAIFDSLSRVWRGVVSVEEIAGKVRFLFEDGGLCDRDPEAQVLRSETGLLGWSSAAAASAVV